MSAIPQSKRVRLSEEDESEIPNIDAKYFEKYASAFVHDEMLRDEARCGAYARSIASNRARIAGSIVLDVGAGSGLLSCLCARAGARRVYAVEASPAAAGLCRDVIDANNLQSVVTVLEGRLEDVELPPDTLVDVVVSEWMGYLLLFESMLDSVLVARDRWLRPGGLLLPDRARLWLCPFSDSGWRRERAEVLSDVCGLNMSVLAAKLADEEAGEPVIQGVRLDQLIGTPCCVAELDLRTVSFEEACSQQCSASWVATGPARMAHGFAGWFDVSFDVPEWSLGVLQQMPSLASRFAREGANTVEDKPAERQTTTSTLTADLIHSPSHQRILLSTGPADVRTCWHQTLLFWRPADQLLLHPGAIVSAEVSMTRPLENKRFLSVSIRSTVESSDAGSRASTSRAAQNIEHVWLLRSYAQEGLCGAPVPRVRGTARAVRYGGAM